MQLRNWQSRILVGLVLGVAGFSPSAQADVSQWLQTEVPFATQQMLANISRPGSAPGSVVAAPSTSPYYLYNWVRDQALTMDVVVSLYGRAASQDKATYSKILTDYVSFSRQLQLTPNNSGGADGLGLGEPKFNLDGSVFQGDWPHPQNDGPALRAITLIHFANLLLAQGGVDYVRRYLYDSKLPSDSVIKNDLEYVAHHWRDPSIDLWEEIRGAHFFTELVQRSALYQGAELADLLGDSAAANYYRQQIGLLEQLIEKHWDSGKNSFVETTDKIAGFSKPSGLDAAVIVAVLRAATDDGYLSVINDRVIATAERIRSAFAPMYSVNQRSADWENLPMGTAIGRYPEDTYNGTDVRDHGNPWFLLTLAYAEFYHRCANTWENAGKIQVSAANVSMLQGLRSYVQGALRAGEVIRSSDPRFAALIQSLRDEGDAEFRRVHFHAGTDGSLWEQFDRLTGYMTSASNLTWSYVALLTAADARK